MMSSQPGLAVPPLVASRVDVGGVVGSGPFQARTVTVKPTDVVLFAESVTLQVTVVVPTGNRLPEAGAHVGARGPSTASIATTAKSTRAPWELVGLTVRSGSEPRPGR